MVIPTVRDDRHCQLSVHGPYACRLPRLRYADSARVVNEARPHSDLRQKLRRWYVKTSLLSWLICNSSIGAPGARRGADRPARLGHDIESGSIAAFDGATRQFVPWQLIRAFVPYRYANRPQRNLFLNHQEMHHDSVAN